MKTLILALLFAAPLILPLHAAPFSATLTRDLDGDGKTEKLLLNTRRDPSLSIWHGKTKRWQGVPQKWAPWKLIAADVDGDGKREFIVGVRKATRFFRFPHNCVFIWSWDGKSATKKWLGSSLSQPFTDFLFYDVDGDREDELVALETRRDSTKCVTVYSWNGFGFDVDWQSVGWNNARLVGAARRQVFVMVSGRKITASQP
jgi:hypothetical protein